MRRRELLASGTALLSVAIAGCGHPDVVLDLEEATSEDIADEVSMSLEPDEEEYGLVESAVENGSTTRRGRYELFDRTNTVRFEGSVYDVSETRLGSSEVTVYEVQIDFDPDDATPELGEIAFEDLPAVDRDHLDVLTREFSPPEQDGPELGVDYGTAEEAGDESVFVPEPEYDVLVHDGTRHRISVDSRTEPQTEYRYEVSMVAADVETFADRIREQYLFELSGLSDAEREVVAEAIDGAYFQDDEAFQSVVEKIRAHEGLAVDDFYGTWLLAYEGVEYITDVEW